MIEALFEDIMITLTVTDRDDKQNMLIILQGCLPLVHSYTPTPPSQARLLEPILGGQAINPGGLGECPRLFV